MAAANPIADSLTQIGAWRVGAYTQDATAVFDHCSLYRVQGDGFAVAVSLTSAGVWSLALEAPDWGLTPQELYKSEILVGATGSYTFTGHAVSARVMALDAAPAIFPQLRTGVTFSVSANQRRYTMTLDGIEAAGARIRDCVRQYAGQAAPAIAPPIAVPPAVAPTAERSANAAVAPVATADAPKKIRPASTGTGFYISTDTLVTNFHLIEGCAQLRVRKNGAQLGTARVVAASRGDDLATLRTDVASRSFLKLRVGAPIKAAEAVLVFGYPLAGSLSSTGNTTLGNVTALTGLNDDSRYIQISASVQPGNSGGPAVDDSGRLMGVVVSKLNAMAVARATGDIPQNVNFAIKVSTLVNFLEVHDIAYETDGATHELSNTQRAEQTEAASIQLECWN
jgi:S1-C subfamily serine protease